MLYQSTATWVYKCTYHLIFTTKYRRKVLTPEAQERCKVIITSLQSDDFSVIEMEVMPDHVHLLFSTNPQIDLKRLVHLIKGTTSHTLRDEFPFLKSRIPSLWTRSKFIATVGSVSLDVVKQYIESQKRS